MLFDLNTNTWVDVDYDLMTHKPTVNESYKAKFEKESGKINLVGADITMADTAVFTGKVITSAVTVKYNGKTLMKDTDYMVRYSNNTAVSMTTATITGRGNYDRI